MGGSTESLPSAKRRKSPAEAVKALLEKVRLVTDDTDTVFRHNGAYWEELSVASLRMLAFDADLGKSTRARRTEIMDEIKARTHIRALKWGRVADFEMPFLNGVVDARTGKLRDHDPEDYLDRVLPWKFEPQAQALIWIETLTAWFGELGGDIGGPIAALQEFFGYCCLSHAKYKRALLVKGASDTGKSIIPFVLGLMVGQDRVASLPLDQMDDPVARAVIVGKALNILTELPVSALIADGGFKQMISTEEPILVNAKFKAPIAYWPTAKHIFLTNNLPGLTDRTEAVLNRLLIIPMDRVFKKEEQDERLQDKLREEISGILIWAMNGAKRLIAQHGKFSNVEMGDEVLDELRRRANPAIDFVKENMKDSETAAVPLVHLVNLYNRWKGGQKVTTRALGKMLRDAGHHVKLVKREGFAAMSLLGHETETRSVPELLAVKPADVLSDATEIDATMIVTRGVGEDLP